MVVVERLSEEIRSEMKWRKGFIPDILRKERKERKEREGRIPWKEFSEDSCRVTKNEATHFPYKERGKY